MCAVGAAAVMRSIAIQHKGREALEGLQLGHCWQGAGNEGVGIPAAATGTTSHRWEAADNCCSRVNEEREAPPEMARVVHGGFAHRRDAPCN